MLAVAARTENHAAHYADRGYVVVRQFFPRALLVEYLDFLKDAMRAEVEPKFAHAGLCLSDPHLGTRVARRIEAEENLSAADRHTLLGHFPLAVRLSQRIRPIAEFLGTSQLLREVLESAQLFMHMPPMSRFVLPNYLPAAVPPHQDASYNAHLSDFVTVWTPLVPIDLACGGLVIYEGSQFVSASVVQTANGWLEPVAANPQRRVQPAGLDVGDVVLLSPRIVHASAPNTSNRIRFSMDLRVFGATARSRKHYMNLQTLETLNAQS